MQETKATDERVGTSCRGEHAGAALRALLTLRGWGQRRWPESTIRPLFWRAGASAGLEACGARAELSSGAQPAAAAGQQSQQHHGPHLHASLCRDSRAAAACSSLLVWALLPIAALSKARLGSALGTGVGAEGRRGLFQRVVLTSDSTAHAAAQGQRQGQAMATGQPWLAERGGQGWHRGSNSKAQQWKLPQT